MTAIDDLHVGNWIAVTGDRDDTDTTSYPYPVYRPEPRFTGEPVKILAISLPFLCIYLPKCGMADTLDVRRVNVTKLHRTYVRRMLEYPTVEAQEAGDVHWSDDQAKPLPGQDSENKRPCPMCGGPMIERSVAGDSRGWHLFCKECGFSGSAE